QPADSAQPGSAPNGHASIPVFAPATVQPRWNAMTSTTHAAARPAHLPAAPALIFALLGLLDIGFLGVVGSSIAPPLAISIVFALLGLVTLVAVVPAWRGSRPALITAVTARVISAVLACGAFIAGAPA